MSTQIAYAFTGTLTDTVRDQSGYLYDLAVAGGTSARGKWDATGSTGGMDCAAGGGKLDMRTPEGSFAELQTGLSSADSYGLMAWVKSNPGSSGTQVLFHAEAETGTGVDFFTVYANAPESGVQVRRGGATITTTANILDGQWHHVSVQAGSDLDSGGIVIKVDDVVVGTAPASALANASSKPYLAIGQTCGGTLAFDGIIDDVRVLNDPIDIASLATSNAGFMNTPVFNQLIAQYGFDEGGGPLAHDTSGYSQNIALSETTHWNTGGEHGGALDTGGGSASGPFGVASIALQETDRVTVLFWLKVTTAALAAVGSSVTSILDIRDSGGDLKLEAMLGGNSAPKAIYVRVYDASGNQWVSSLNHSLVADEWHHFAVSMFPTGFAPTWDGLAFGGGSGFTANPFAGWDVLNVGYGRFGNSPAGVLVDDLRVVNNYLYPEAIRKHMALADATPPIGVNVAAVSGTEADMTITRQFDATISTVSGAGVDVTVRRSMPDTTTAAVTKLTGSFTVVGSGGLAATIGAVSGYSGTFTVTGSGPVNPRPAGHTHKATFAEHPRSVRFAEHSRGVTFAEHTRTVTYRQETPMRIASTERDFYALTPSISPALTAAGPWEATFDGGTTWLEARVDDNGDISWLVAGDLFEAVGGLNAADTDVTLTVGSHVPRGRCVGDPVLVIEDMPAITITA